MVSPPRPIGYWLKRLDRTIEDGFERDLAAFGISRRHWQVLNTLSAGPAAPAVVSEALAPFWTEGAITEDRVLRDLADRGWVEQGTDRLVLTEAGMQAHGRVKTRVDATRARVLDGLTTDDYATVLRLLEHMTRNLEQPR